MAGRKSTSAQGQPGRVSGLVEPSYRLLFFAVFFFVDFLAVFFLAAM
jgi:hypothetical protein